MDAKLEVVVVPVTDVARSREFYADRLGFVVDQDLQLGPMRVVQLTPRGSACSITIGPVVVDSRPENGARLQFVVEDVAAAREELLARGVEVSEVQHFEEGRPVPGHGGDFNSFVFLEDPDGNGLALQEIRGR